MSGFYISRLPFHSLRVQLEVGQNLRNGSPDGSAPEKAPEVKGLIFQLLPKLEERVHRTKACALTPNCKTRASSLWPCFLQTSAVLLEDPATANEASSKVTATNQRSMFPDVS